MQDDPKAHDQSTADYSDFLWRVHAYINDYIKFADAKAAFIAAACSGVIGALVASTLFDSCFRNSLSDWTIMQFAGMLGLILLVISFGLSIATIQPRLWSKSGSGFIYWGSVIAHGSAKDHTAAVHQLTQRQMSEETAKHVFTLSMIADRKFKRVSWALAVGVLGGLLSAVVLFIQRSLR